MTCYFDPTTGAVFDHEGGVVGDLNDTDWQKTWSGRCPDEVIVMLKDAVDETKSDSYNQSLLTHIATDDIEPGTPP
jgi:hypothetical protein